MNTQLERMESLLYSFPGVIEISTLRALSLRVTQLEQLVTQHVHLEHARVSNERSRKQLIVSVTALVVTAILWGLWLALQLLS